MNTIKSKNKIITKIIVVIFYISTSAHANNYFTQFFSRKTGTESSSPTTPKRNNQLSNPQVNSPTQNPAALPSSAKPSLRRETHTPALSTIINLPENQKEQAGGGSEGVGGGDLCAEEIRVVISEIKKWIKDDGHKELDFSKEGITADEYKIKMTESIEKLTNYECVSEGDKRFPVEVQGKARLCKVEWTGNKSHFVCDFLKFMALTPDQVFVKIHHELAQPAGFEKAVKNVPQFHLSNQLAKQTAYKIVQKIVPRLTTPPQRGQVKNGFLQLVPVSAVDSNIKYSWRQFIYHFRMRIQLSGMTLIPCTHFIKLSNGADDCVYVDSGSSQIPVQLDLHTDKNIVKPGLYKLQAPDYSYSNVFEIKPAELVSFQIPILTADDVRERIEGIQHYPSVFLYDVHTNFNIPSLRERLEKNQRFQHEIKRRINDQGETLSDVEEFFRFLNGRQSLSYYSFGDSQSPIPLELLTDCGESSQRRELFEFYELHSKPYSFLSPINKYSPEGKILEYRTLRTHMWKRKHMSLACSTDHPPLLGTKISEKILNDFEPVIFRYVYKTKNNDFIASLDEIHYAFQPISATFSKSFLLEIYKPNKKVPVETIPFEI